MKPRIWPAPKSFGWAISVAPEAHTDSADRRRSATHLVYIGIEGLKVVALPVLGTAYALQALT